jgi:hypothetical protein
MYKKTITYVDFNGVEREEDFYFHLTEAEQLKLEFSENGGLSNILDSIIESDDIGRIMELFERLIRLSYGRRTDDGKNFIKKADYADEFIASEAWSNLFMEFLNEPDTASEFVNSIVTKVAKDDDKKSIKALIKEKTISQ